MTSVQFMAEPRDGTGISPNLVGRLDTTQAPVNVSGLVAQGGARNLLRRIETSDTVEELDRSLYQGLKNFTKGHPMSLFFAFINLQYVQNTADKESLHYKIADEYLRKIPEQVKQYGTSTE